MTDTKQFSAAELRAQANFGKVYIGTGSGSAVIHPGKEWFDRAVEQGYVRPATDAEITALRTIPEFSAHLAKIRGEA